MWVCILFERFVCCRPLHRVSAWLADMGLAISPGTLADSVKRFVPLFEPVAKAILAHQNKAALRHADETTWRVQAYREKGRSSRAWLWTSVSGDAVYFHIDPSRSAEVAKALFGGAIGIVVLVCDRLSTYKSLARELDGKVILQWCWVYVAAPIMLRRVGTAPAHIRTLHISATKFIDSHSFAMVMSPTTRRYDYVRGFVHGQRHDSQVSRRTAA